MREQKWKEYTNEGTSVIRRLRFLVVSGCRVLNGNTGELLLYGFSAGRALRIFGNENEGFMVYRNLSLGFVATISRVCYGRRGTREPEEQTLIFKGCFHPQEIRTGETKIARYFRRNSRQNMESFEKSAFPEVPRQPTHRPENAAPFFERSIE